VIKICSVVLQRVPFSYSFYEPEKVIKICSLSASFFNELDTESELCLGSVSFLHKLEIENKIVLGVGFIFT
jgi:hypothetical protein